jgi:hypothetical protein
MYVLLSYAAVAYTDRARDRQYAGANLYCISFVLMLFVRLFASCEHSESHAVTSPNWL